MGFFDLLAKMLPIRENAQPEKVSDVQGLEEVGSVIEWGSVLRADDFVDYNDFLSAYKKHPTVYAVINLLARNIVNNGFQFVPKEYVKNPSDVQYNDLQRYIKRVSPDGFFSFREVIYSAVCDLLRDGMKPIEIDKGDMPFLYGTLEMSKLRPRIYKNGLFKNDGQGHWEQIIEGSVVTTFDNKDLIWLKLPDSSNLIFSHSPLEPMLLGIESDLAGKQFNYNRFYNNAYVGLTVILPEKANRNDAIQMLQHLQTQYRSKKTAFGETEDFQYKPLVLYGGSSIDTGIVESFKDIDFMQLREVTDKEICRVYGIPYRLLLDEMSGLGQAGATAEALNNFYVSTVYPYQKMIEEAINDKLFEQRLQVTDWDFQFVRPVAIDKQSAVNNRLAMVDKKVMLPLEARKGLREFYPEMDEENDFEFEKEEAEPIIDNPMIEDSLEDNEEDDDKDKSKSCGCNITVKAKTPMVLKSFDIQSVKSFFDNNEMDINDGMNLALAKMSESAKKNLPKMVTDKDWNAIMKYSFPYKNDLTNSLVNEGKKAFTEGGRFINREIGQKAELNLGDYERLVKYKATQAGVKITLQLEETLKTQLLDMISRKDVTENAVMGAIEQLFQEQYVKSPTVSRTLTTNFYNLGIDKQIQEVKKFVPKVQYQAVLDGRQSDRCDELNGVIVAVDSDLYEKIRPPQHFNCRSVLVPVTVIDIEENPLYGKDTSRNDITRALSKPGFEVI